MLPTCPFVAIGRQAVVLWTQYAFLWCRVEFACFCKSIGLDLTEVRGPTNIGVWWTSRLWQWAFSNIQNQSKRFWTTIVFLSAVSSLRTSSDWCWTLVLQWSWLFGFLSRRKPQAAVAGRLQLCTEGPRMFSAHLNTPLSQNQAISLRDEKDQHLDVSTAKLPACRQLFSSLLVIGEGLCFLNGFD